MQPYDGTLSGVQDYYDHWDERDRLSSVWGQVEYVRTQTIISRFLNGPPAVVLDVGGAAGRYACWLARKGYTVHLVDPVPLHVRQAEEASSLQPDTPIASCQVGDARLLAFADGLADAVLLMGPLYHIVRADERHRALVEAHRVLKTGGHILAVGISRFASTIDGLVEGYYRDPAFRRIMRHDLEDGQHQNPTQNPAYFTDAFFHHPEELVSEVVRTGFELEGLLAVEGISYMMKDLAQSWGIESHREFLLELIARTEREPSLIGASPHLMCVAVKS